jgi:hypothetical protein
MKTRDEQAILMERILALQHKQSSELQILKQQFEITYESLQPLNFIKSTIKEIVTSPDIKSDIINGVIGLGTNYVSNNFLNPTSKSPIKKLLAKGLKMALKNFVGKK